MKIGIGWFITIIIAAYLVGLAIELFGRNCPKCVERRKKWFPMFYKDTEQGNPYNSY